MRIRGYLPRGIALTWLLGIKIEECDAPMSKDKLRDIINRFISFALGNVPVKYEIRELSRSYVIRFIGEAAELAALCRKYSDYEFKSCVYMCVSDSKPLAECEEACQNEVMRECGRYGEVAIAMSLASIAHDLASLFEACNVRYYAHYGASKDMHSTLFVAFFE
jgi:hypothetical protein